MWRIFHGPVILPYISKTVRCLTILLRDYESNDPMFDLKINVGHCDLYFMVQWFALYLEDYLIIRWDNDSVWPDFWTQYKCWSICSVEFFHWFCFISLRLFDVWISYFEYDSMFDLKINVGHRDQYFMCQWFCLISWRLFDVWTSYFGIMSQYNPTFDLRINVGHSDLYFIVHDFALYLEDCLIYEHHTLGLWVSITRCLMSK